MFELVVCVLYQLSWVSLPRVSSHDTRFPYFRIKINSFDADCLMLPYHYRWPGPSLTIKWQCYVGVGRSSSAIGSFHFSRLLTYLKVICRCMLQCCDGWNCCPEMERKPRSDPFGWSVGTKTSMCDLLRDYKNKRICLIFITDWIGSGQINLLLTWSMCVIFSRHRACSRSLILGEN